MKTSTTALRLSLLALAGAVLMLSSCGDSDPVAPGIQPEIINSVDNFQFQVTAVTNFSGVLDYNWQTTGTVADINQSAAVTGGTVILTLLDNAGAAVYSNNLAQDGSFVTSAGATGTWKIRLTFTNTSGTLNFRADKRL